MKKSVYSPLLVCFLFSGAAGLIYEVVWARQLSLFVGITTFAHTAVITAYMMGLAAGSLVIGRISDRHPSPLRLYAWLEMAIGFYAAATPWLIPWLQQFYIELIKIAGVTGLPSHLLRFVMALLLLLPPTFLMGGTLPAMVKGMSAALPDIGTASGRLYGINTLGAVIGTVAAGYLLIPMLGMRNTLFTAVALNFFVAGTVMVLSGKVKAPKISSHDKNTEPHRDALRQSGSMRLALVLFALSGFASLAYQIAWIRALTLVIGSSVYSFSATLAAFLSGIGFGSLIYGRLIPRCTPSERLLRASVFTMLTGFSAILGLLLIGKLPQLFLWGFQHDWGFHFATRQLFMFVLSMAVMIVPTLFMGAMFPLMISLWSRRREVVGTDVGIVYAANTSGCILGSLLAGLVLLPVLGIQGVVVFAAGLHVLVGAGFGWMGMASRSIGFRAAQASFAALVFALVVYLVPAWDKSIMTSGVFNYVSTIPGRSAKETLESRKQSSRMLYYQEGLDGTVSVIEDETQRKLVINGKIDATSQHDLLTQIMIGQLPVLMHPAPRRVLIIGLGSGITAGSVAKHEAIEAIDILEISPEVVEASGYFSEHNHRVINDPRVNLIVADARNFLLGAGPLYDVIISEPSNPWISGIANLFTRDFFALLNTRLAPGGILSQWFHIYNMSTEDTRSVMRSYHDIYPYVSIWQGLDSDLMMIGSAQPHAVDGLRYTQRMIQPDIRHEFQRAGKYGLDRIAAMLLLDNESLATYCGDALLNTDDRPRVEFSAPQNLYLDTTGQTLRGIIQHMKSYPISPLIVNVARAEGRNIDLFTAGLTIKTAHMLAPEQWQAGYRVWRELFQTGTGKPDALGVGSQVYVDWQDGEFKNRLKAFNFDEPLSMEKLTEYLLADKMHVPLLGGEVDLPGGKRGAWLLVGHDGSDQLTYLITWMESQPNGEYMQYVAERNQTDPGEAERGAALLNFARCFVPSSQ